MMTIRNYIRGRYYKGALLGGFVAVVVGVAALALPRLHVSKPLIAALYYAVIVLPAYWVAISYMARTRCPRCEKQLGIVAQKVGRNSSSAPSTCPHCKMNFDKPMPIVPDRERDRIFVVSVLAVCAVVLAGAWFIHANLRHESLCVTVPRLDARATSAPMASCGDPRRG
jgi:hypothetical protein